MRKTKELILAVAMIAAVITPAAGEESSFVTERHIALGAVRGRIDHLAVDLQSRRLFVAELGNDSVSVIDLTTAKVVARISGLAHPQGLGWDASSHSLWIANAGDGSVRVFEDSTWKPVGRIDLGEDADNIRIEGARVFVGYGSGAIAVIDPTTRKVVSSIPLRGHPESFQVDTVRDKAFVNVPDAGEIAVLDLKSGAQVESWKLRGISANFPMALAPDGIIVAARQPSVLLRYGFDGTLLWKQPTCGDADDVFYDPHRGEIDVICGEGVIERRTASSGGRVGRVPTAPRARTALLLPDLDRLVVAVPSPRAGLEAELLVLQPVN